VTIGSPTSPDGYENGWNDCRAVASTPARTENIDDVSLEFYLVGYSNGGQMALRLASESPERLRGLALIAANLPAPGSTLCDPPATTVPTLVMSGTSDPISPFEGGPVSIFGFSPRGDVLSSDETASAFLDANGITGEPTVTQLPHLDRSG
jgi:polyhydroxybutyrate depolymerase